MNWEELLCFLENKRKTDPSFLQDKVMVYDRSLGEYYDCDLIELEDETDYVLNQAMFFQTSS